MNKINDLHNAQKRSYGVTDRLSCKVEGSGDGALNLKRSGDHPLNWWSRPVAERALPNGQSQKMRCHRNAVAAMP